jgi:hypothetical protein
MLVGVVQNLVLRVLNFMLKDRAFWNDCTMTNVMYKFIIYLSIFFCLTCFGISFSPPSEAGVKIRQWFKSPGYGFSAWALTPYPGGVNHCQNCTPASEDGLKESPKHVRQ